MTAVRSWAWRIGPLLVAALVWELLVRTGVLDAQFFPPLHSILQGFVEAFTAERIYADIAVTLQRLGIAFVVAALLGIPLAIGIGRSQVIDGISRPFVDTLYPVPKVALLPMIILLTGAGEVPLLLVTGLTAFLQITISVSGAVRSIDTTLLEAGSNFGATGVRHITRVVLPALMPAIFSALRTALGLCLVTLIVVEFLSSRTGLGAFVAISWQTLSVNLLYVGVLVTAVLGHGLNALLRIIERKSLPWNVSWAGAAP
ncbi:ABC transporter permease [Modestobacter lapidis]|nr:ABC transporter permease [Modestobacter lapidis]